MRGTTGIKSNKGKSMASVNRVTIIGNLGRDPEMRSFPSGDQVANVTLPLRDIELRMPRAPRVS